MDDDPSFEIPTRPRREYHDGGVEYAGRTAFVLRTATDGDGLDDWVDRILDGERYTRGDWFDLPSPVYLVYDEAIGTVFRVVVHDRRVELHVLPDTDPAGLRAFYDALRTVSDASWSVSCETEP